MPLTPGLAEAGGSLRDGQAYAVNGQRPESNNFLIDGANNFNGVDGGFVLKPPVDAITEFKILTHNANAEFGDSLGSTTNIITRSGTNGFHGALWEFLRNDVFRCHQLLWHDHRAAEAKSIWWDLRWPHPQGQELSSSDITRAFATARVKRTRRPCHRLAERQGNFQEICPEGFTGGFCNNPEPPALQCLSQPALSQQPV